MYEQLGASMVAVVGLVVLILAVTVGFNRRLSLVEYRWTRTRCPACGRTCFGRRNRRTVREPWGAWESECCAEPLDLESD